MDPRGQIGGLPGENRVGRLQMVQGSIASGLTQHVWRGRIPVASTVALETSSSVLVSSGRSLIVKVVCAWLKGQ